MAILCDGLGIHIWIFPVDSNWNQRQKIKEAVINQALVVWGQLSKGLLFSFPGSS